MRTVSQISYSLMVKIRSHCHKRDMVGRNELCCLSNRDIPGSIFLKRFLMHVGHPFYVPGAGNTQTGKICLSSRTVHLGADMANRCYGCINASWLEQAACHTVLRRILIQQEEVL